MGMLRDYNITDYSFVMPFGWPFCLITILNPRYGGSNADDTAEDEAVGD
jgi:hypothetical protein